MNRDQQVYETARRIYLSTDSDIIRHVMENVIVELLRKGVRPCHR